jgi:hypothetical protein
VATALILPAPQQAQTFREDCTSATLTGAATLPFSDAGVAGGDRDFTLPAGCQLGNTAFSDVVVCFTPQSGCTVAFACSASGGSNVRASILGGPCTASFANCLAAGADVVPAATSTANLALVAGQSYCFVCQNTIGNGDFTAGVSATSGNCGALPVQLLSFGIASGR